jgi:hypothetical protein
MIDLSAEFSFLRPKSVAIVCALTCYRGCRTVHGFCEAFDKNQVFSQLACVAHARDVNIVLA